MSGWQLRSERHGVENLDDAIELCFERGWTDGLPVVPPTPEKVLRFVELAGRGPDEGDLRVPKPQPRRDAGEGRDQLRDGG